MNTFQVRVTTVRHGTQTYTVNACTPEQAAEDVAAVLGISPSAVAHVVQA